MAKQTEWPNTGPRDYNSFCDGNVWELDEADFVGKRIERIRASFIAAAHRKGLRSKTTIKDGKLYVQAVPKTRALKVAAR